jgi:hypothetical protein
MKQLLAILLFLGINLFSSGQIQPETKVIGRWSGNIELPTSKLEVIFHILSDSANQLVTKMEVPLQGVKNMTVNKTEITTDSMKLSVAAVMGSYKGRFINDSTVDGRWNQSGASLPLKLQKGIISKKLNRPQTPKPPFPYSTREVSYTNPESGFKITGTLTMPEKGEKFPAVILISGSGAQDRDETIFEHKPFFVLADFLTREGIAVLRVDDRGVGGSEGKTSEATSKDFAGDVLAGIEFLKRQSEINPLQIGLIGHSEGGIVAPLTATLSSEPAFIVLLAGPALTGEQIIYEQGKLINIQAGMSEELAEQNRQSQEALFEIIKSETDAAQRTEKLKEMMSNGMYDLMSDDLKINIDNQVKTVDNNWFRFFLTYDPYPALTKITCPVLALNGEKDLQVPPKTNLPLIEKALTEGKNPQFKTMEIPGVNHLFQNCSTGAIAEYGEIEETISPGVLEIIIDWIVNYGLKK